LAYLAQEVVKKKSTDVTTLSEDEIDQLFDAYDKNNIGFIKVGFLLERVRAALPDSVYLEFKDSINSVSDDEMVNHTEFIRLLQPYIGR
jgi:Ca2+-binding EF-hand superfamily protein